MRHSLIRLVLLLLWLLALALALAIGDVLIPPNAWQDVLLGQSQGTYPYILWEIRLPRVLTATFSGMALAAAGLVLQALFRNPLAGPSVLGVNAGASLVVALLLLPVGVVSPLSSEMKGSWGTLAVVGAALLGSFLVLFFLLALSRRIRDAAGLLIAGLMTSYLSGAVVSIVQYYSNPEKIQRFLVWSFGSFGGLTLAQALPFAASLLLLCLVLVSLLPHLDVQLLGEDYSQSLGLHTRRTRNLLIVLTGLLVAIVTAFCGPVAFLGVATPHICRGLHGGGNHRRLYPSVLLAGALLGLLCDWVAQMPGLRTSFPLNAVTALVGAPVVLWIVLRNRYLSGYS